MYLLLDIIRFTLHGTPSAEIKVSTTDWSALYTEAKKHGIMGVVWPGVHQLLTEAGPETSNLPASQLSALKTWYNTVQYNQQLYARHRDFIARMAHLYEMIGIHTMLLKGYGLSLNYPYPSFRPVGDIDIYLFEENAPDSGGAADPRPVWQRGDDMVTAVLQATIDASHDHHTIFHVEGITVENHYDFTVLTHHKSNLPLERTLKELALDHFIKSILATS